jgi:hypothetical protein
MALLVRANGGIDEVHPLKKDDIFSYRDLQEFVGGYIEQLPSVCVPVGKQVFCNEDSRELKHPYNSEASKRYGRILCPHHPSLGTMKLCDAKWCQFWCQFDFHFRAFCCSMVPKAYLD